jgi:hypothetical protein
MFRNTIDKDNLREQDTCLTQSSSFSRRAVLTMLFISMLSGMVLLILVEDRPFGVQFSSAVLDTAAVALYTLSRNRNGMQAFLSCPVVRSQMPRLIRRHLAFLGALFVIQTGALELRPNLSPYWISSSDPSPFSIVLCILCACVAVAQVLSNRSLLEGAHDSAQSDKDSYR